MGEEIGTGIPRTRVPRETKRSSERFVGDTEFLRFDFAIRFASLRARRIGNGENIVDKRTGMENHCRCMFRRTSFVNFLSRIVALRSIHRMTIELSER